MSLRIKLTNKKHYLISGIHPLLLYCLQELPQILEQRDSPAAIERLIPDLMADNPDANDEWREMMGPELRHLFVSAGDTVLRDLATLKPAGGKSENLQLLVPIIHVDAWISALNEARLILGALYEIQEEDLDLEIDTFDLSFEKHKAILQVHLLGEIQQLLIEHLQQDESTDSI